MSKWMVSAKKADFARIAERFHISPVTARLIRNRGMVTDEEIAAYLYGDLSACHDAALLPDAEKAAGLLLEAVRSGAHIRVVGDYDVDGICSTVILVRALRLLRAVVDYEVPHRVRDGYGINDAIVDRAHADGVRLILTCDNGIAAFQQAKRAADYGMLMIITDHHDIPVDAESNRQRLPDADAVVDPKRGMEETYPFSGICGAVVAYKLMQILFRMTEEKDGADRLMDNLTELCAVATVCDVMPLENENRPIVREGMRRMTDSAFAGLRALMRVNALSGSGISVYQLGFVIGPCLNATGRLDSAKRGVELLLTDDDDEAVRIAAELKELNTSRRQMTERYLDEAVAYVRTQGAVLDKVLVIDLRDAHEAVAGIVAGRVKDAFHRPAIVLTRGTDGVKGSARSVPGYDMFRALSRCAELFAKFGGHPMAAGLTLRDGVDAGMLRERLNADCTLTEDDLEEVLHLDMELPPQCATLSLLREWACLEPFGNGNERPLFAARDLCLRRGRMLGKSGTVGKFEVTDTAGNRFDVMLFRGLDRWNAFLDASFGQDVARRLYLNGLAPDENITVKIAYRADINEYRGRQSVQLVMEDYRI